jgi:hypothetical protein
LRAKIGDGKENAEERIENTVEAFDDGRRDFGRHPKGWHEFSPISASRSLPMFSTLSSSRFLI